MGERAPQHIQNLAIRDYCERNRLQFLLSATEYAMEGCHMMFEQLLEELPTIDGVVAYSLFQLNAQPSQRRRIYETVLAHNKTLHFAVEDCHADTASEFDRIETLWRIRHTLSHCPQTLASAP